MFGSLCYTQVDENCDLVLLVSVDGDGDLLLVKAGLLTPSASMVYISSTKFSLLKLQMRNFER